MLPTDLETIIYHYVNDLNKIDIHEELNKKFYNCTNCCERTNKRILFLCERCEENVCIECEDFIQCNERTHCNQCFLTDIFYCTIEDITKSIITDVEFDILLNYICDKDEDYISLLLDCLHEELGSDYINGEGMLVFEEINDFLTDFEYNYF